MYTLVYRQSWWSVGDDVVGIWLPYTRHHHHSRTGAVLLVASFEWCMFISARFDLEWPSSWVDVVWFRSSPDCAVQVGGQSTTTSALLYLLVPTHGTILEQRAVKRGKSAKSVSNVLSFSLFFRFVVFPNLVQWRASSATSAAGLRPIQVS